MRLFSHICRCMPVISPPLCVCTCVCVWGGVYKCSLCQCGECVHMCVCVCVCVRVRVRARVCVHACVCMSLSTSMGDDPCVRLNVLHIGAVRMCVCVVDSVCCVCGPSH